MYFTLMGEGKYVRVCTLVREDIGLYMRYSLSTTVIITVVDAWRVPM